jgi:hypothetical protein
MTVLDDIQRMEATDAPQLEVGFVVHEALRREGRRIELTAKGARAFPGLKAEHPLRPWMWEMSEYVRLRCSRCDTRFPHSGLRWAYWGAWCCQDCCRALGAVGGTLDHDGWPQADRRAA